MTNQKPIVYLGLSGGVDSALAGALLLEQGYDVRGVFLKIWSDDLEDAGYCPWVEDRRDAIAIAAQLNIPIETVNFEKEYKEYVFSYFVQEYTAGRTPNPDILCNQVIKFGSFLDWALENGADYIATGHHIRRFPQSGKEQRDGYKILRGIDSEKDQSYFLASLNQHQLRHSLFPIGVFTKAQVREKAKALGLDLVADKPSTKGICFVGDVKLKKFLEQYTIQDKGVIQDKNGNQIGEHDGVAFYTIGQRKGLHIKVQSEETKPYFVVKKDAKSNTLIVSNNEQDLLEDSLICEELYWVDGKIKKLPMECKAKIRYNQDLQDVELSFRPHEDESKLFVRFMQSQRAITPGQVIVFYQGDELLGNAIIS